jgi:hypothetical protein
MQNLFNVVWRIKRFESFVLDGLRQSWRFVPYESYLVSSKLSLFDFGLWGLAAWIEFWGSLHLGGWLDCDKFSIPFSDCIDSI